MWNAKGFEILSPPIQYRISLKLRAIHNTFGDTRGGISRVYVIPYRLKETLWVRKFLIQRFIEVCVEVSSVLIKACSELFLCFFVCQPSRMIHRTRATGRDPLPVCALAITLCFPEVMIPFRYFVLMVLLFMALAFRQFPKE